MHREKVSSEAINSIGYDSKKRVLEIEFNSGSVYQYFSVPEDEAKSFESAESNGTYFHNRILGRYEFIRLDLLKKTNNTIILPLKPPRLPHL